MKYAESKTARSKSNRKVQLSDMNLLFFLLEEQFITNADAYLHYSNNILFEINRIETTAILLILIYSNNSSLLRRLLLTAMNAEKIHIRYSEFKPVINAFDGVIERYCGVPP